MDSMLSLKKSDMRWFEYAKREAEKSIFPRFHVGCVLVYKNHIIGAACNTDKSDPVQKKYNRYRHFNHTTRTCVNHSGHAEMLALKKVSYPIAQQIDWKEVKCYTVRIAPGLPQGRGLSRPCAACRTALVERGVRDFYYSTDMGYAHERIMND